MGSITQFVTLLFFIFYSRAAGSNSTTFTIVNRCSFIVFPGIFHGTGSSLPSTTGFSLHPGESNVLTMPRSWSGRLWGRTHCSHSNGKFSCLTGDCASSTIECNGINASPPATLAEFNLNTGFNGYDYFDVSVVNGYNLPMMVEAQVGNGFGNCITTGCMVHLNKTCPSELKVMSNGDCIGCRSATQPFSKYSEFFTKACPHAKVYATSTFQISVCASTDYLITFCPISTSRIEPRKEENPTYVDNSGVEKKGSSNNNIVKIIFAVVAAFLVTGGGLYVAFSCYTYISYSTNHGWNFGLSAGIKSRWPQFCS